MHVIVGLEVGGAEHMLHRLVLAQQKDSTADKCTVVSLTDAGPLGLQLSKDGIDVVALEMRSPLGLLMVVWRLRSLILQRSPNVVQTWMYHADLMGGVAARLAGIKNVIWGVRTTDVKAGGSRATAIVRKVCALLSHFVPHTIVCAAEASRLAHIAVGYDSSRMAVVPNGFDLARLVSTQHQRDARRQQCGLGVDQVVVGYVGRFHPVKDQQNFVRAAGMVAQQHSNARFLMVGRDLDGANVQLAQWIQATGYAERFVLLGERADVPVCLSAMDLFCLSSRNEGFPNVVAEAMAMGLPCVVTDVGDAAMLVADTGVVVPKENSAALAQGMVQLLTLSVQERQALGRSARVRIEQEFSMERCTQRFEAVYADVLNNPRG
jgi:glycosyltransferase involved in cell wall biosynthesis